MPRNAEVREGWRYMKDDRRPSYVDQLHVYPPWSPDREGESVRIGQLNAAAYRGAKICIVATGVGGGGVNTIVEQRLVGERASDLPASFGHQCIPIRPPKGLEGSDSSIETISSRENFAMPTEEQIAALELKILGHSTHPTRAEIERRKCELDSDPVS
ncbi:MAG: hypothetical protein M1840_002763 [Geoglossum simile]|nr:MAG: hypothetical protein M1840_002763 [Geoglossum simile]